MLAYSRLAQLLEEIGRAPRGEKVDLVSSFLAGLEPEQLPVAVRLLMGELWPPWEEKVLGLGPESLMKELQEISREDVPQLREGLGESGAVAMKSLLQKRQQTLSMQPLDALSLYRQLRKAATFSGQDSEHRRDAVLRGLLLDCTPLEGKYLARTIEGNMRSGLGTWVMRASIAQAFGPPQEELTKAYNLCPDLGTLAETAARRELCAIKIRPLVPLRLMRFGPGEPAYPAAFLLLYPGLRVQVHKYGDRVGIYTSRLRNATSSLAGLVPEVLRIEHDFIMDANLLIRLENRILGQAEVVRYINRRHLSRRSGKFPALVAYDLLYLDGQDLTAKTYQERRERLLSVVGKPVRPHFQGLTASDEMVFPSPAKADSYGSSAEHQGATGLLARALSGFYLAGERSRVDFLVQWQRTLRMAVVRAEPGSGRRRNLLARYGLALRDGDDLVLVGWASSGLALKEAHQLSDHLHNLIQRETAEGLQVRPQVVLTVKVGRSGPLEDDRLHRARIVGVQYQASPAQVDELSRLDELCLTRS
ncbi:MAG: hypothetical protein HPY61_01025 [Methanotrichaceae archaeon]|nr:hypothetical protein [Methanotrichaceae archaeon]